LPEKPSPSAGAHHSQVPLFVDFIHGLRDFLCIALALFARLSLQRERAILMYHSVDTNDDFFTVTPQEFERQIEYLKEGYSVVSLDEIAGYIRNSTKLPRKSVAITFDDGYQDCYLHAYPYLRKSNLPATVFVSTAYVGKEWPFEPYRSTNRFRLMMLTWDEIREMSKNNIDIGAHTATHLDLQEADLRTARKEILESKQQIERHIQKTVRHFSFPKGRCSPKTASLVKSLGFETAVGSPSLKEGQETPNGFVLHRVQVDSSVSLILFRARLTKASDWVRQLERIMAKMLGIAR
jgi:peptidoglycan/xylan/chitin deacetylase (PgdA/CDA1 family)